MGRLSRLLAIFRRYRMAQSTEAALQRAIVEVLTAEAVPFERELRLGPGARPDFFVEPGVCIEVKIQGPASAVRRQLERYAEHERVKVILLLTTRRDYDMPPELVGKPVMVLCVGSAFL